ncbi:uncharacterized protein TEOVI_000580800 [Trypanosoma equiperdum]|uniref:Uncharacterized protein n=2 Tax=Trypanozoon TaxID=39700 RepID=Q57VE6_TRYB2|nr:hypothetical protein, conserved [Trypanosoma brucei brucei TREU927]AAX70471.1 hypothetical protein, conserved [Trypanosoma brucei]AAZ11232.1 hypothetical protein, conserved [Trypanosoma brucei brucei TREU927]SCU66094.1 hypothetical protein, conserved [Trypanosoma equiperdum]
MENKMSAEPRVVSSTNVSPDEEEEEELGLPLVPLPHQRSPLGTSSKCVQGNHGGDVAAGGSDDDEDDLIKYVSNSSSKPLTSRVNMVYSSASQKRPRNDSELEPGAMAADMATEHATLPDDTDHPQDMAEYERWKDRDAARAKDELMSLLSGSA